jgi:hypothetical protein
MPPFVAIAASLASFCAGRLNHGTVGMFQDSRVVMLSAGLFYLGYRPSSCRADIFPLCAMYGRRPRFKRNDPLRALGGTRTAGRA